MMKGSITSIQRMSIHDGPGIRSTVFFKGCNFRCKWCHNPETWVAEKQLQIVNSRCISCGSCVSACSQSLISLVTDGISVDRTNCKACGDCVEQCASGALSIAGIEIDAQEVVEQLLRDKIYYEQSGGGVTLSGGEPLLQIYFAKEILELCKQYKIHTAVETNLSVSRKTIELLHPFVDLWLVDLKIADDVLHREWTGSTNKNTINNLRFLNEKKAEIIVRTPIVPGVNDSPEAITAICELLNKISIKQYDIIPFHTLGFDKFNSLGIQNPLADMLYRKVDSFDSLKNIVIKYNANKNM